MGTFLRHSVHTMIKKLDIRNYVMSRRRRRRPQQAAAAAAATAAAASVPIL